MNDCKYGCPPPEVVMEQCRHHVEDDDGAGWFCPYVYPEPGNDPPIPGFTYTVGLWKNWRHPEVFFTGLPALVGHSILAAIADSVSVSMISAISVSSRHAPRACWTSPVASMRST